jgi:Nop53 (60S ribosomal biogenesis).
MAKKKGVSKRAQKRANASAVELLEQSIEKQEASRFEEKDDSELFVVETIPNNTSSLSTSKKRKSEHNTSALINVKQGKKNRISEKDERQIKTIMKKHSKEELVSMAAASKQRLTEAKKSKRNPGTAKASFDLWDNSAVENEKQVTMPVISGAMSMAGTAPIQFQQVPKTSLKKNMQLQSNLSKKQLKARNNFEKNAPVSIKVDPAQPGQSYRPDKEQHQDAIGEALSIEIRRNEALEYKRTPIGNGQLSEETMALIVGSSDDESSDEEESDLEDVVIAHQKRTEKLTRTQRNKQKRVKAERVALEERRRKKKLMNQLEQAKKVAKEIKEEEAVKIARRQEINALRVERDSQPVGVNVFEKISELDPINAPSLPVALTDELKNGSLRAIKPKGSLLTDRLESMISRKMANRKSKEKKKVVQGKRRNITLGAKGGEFLLT